MSLKKLKNKADKTFSEFVRKRDAYDDGIAICCTCGKMDHWKNMDCGHYLSRRYLSIRYEEKNTGVQCKSCNVFNQGEQVKFREYLVNRYGEEEIQKIEIQSRNIVKDSRLLYMSVIENFKS